MSELFALRGQLSRKSKAAIEIFGFVFFVVLWWTISDLGFLPRGIFPHPWKVLLSFGELYTEHDIITHTIYSLKINFFGYCEAVLLALPLGFLIGLLPVCRGLSERIMAASRFLPLPAVTGVMIAAFGIGTIVKIHFLALSIFVYLLPVVVQRIDEVDEVYVQTVKTLGANHWQTIRHVFFPLAVCRISDDIRVLVAISWTYIVIAEGINRGDGGLGAMTFDVSYQHRIDMLYALLVIIMLIGFLQDKLFNLIDRALFPHKYA